MKTKYLVKVTETATKENENFFGEVHTCWYGKFDHLCGMENTRDSNFRPCGYDIFNYGYDRICDAKRNWFYNNPQNDKFWTSAVKIVEFADEEVDG